MEPPDSLNRREFIASLGVIGAAAVTGDAAGRAAALAGAGLPREGDYIHEGMRIVAQTSFEEGQAMLGAPEHRIDGGMARTGACSLKGEADGSGILEVPFEARKGEIVNVQFWIRGEETSECAVHIVNETVDRRIGRAGRIAADDWRFVEFFHPVRGDVKGVLRIRASSTDSASPGAVWIDDLVVTVFAESGWPDRVEDFPAPACDGEGRLWTVVLERKGFNRHIGVYHADEGRLERVCILRPESLTGIGPPAAAAAAKGVVAVFPVELEDRWRIAYVLVNDKTPDKPVVQFIDTQGTANVAPAVAMSGKIAHVIWESNAGKHRGIYTCRLDARGQGEVKRISAEHAHSHNPAIVSLDDGSLFAAWDSVRGGSADIYGAFFKDGAWQEERRITQDARIERHPSLAARDGQVWMAWQAQSFEGSKINHVSEQRIAVARIDGEDLLAPHGLFERVSTPAVQLMRPRIAFDADGRLWLTARRSIHNRHGWHPVAWCYSGRKWWGPEVLMSVQGRWRPVEMVFTPEDGAAAVQYDDLPNTWTQQGKNRDWNSTVAMVALTGRGEPAFKPLKTRPMKMPRIDFSLAKKMKWCAAEFPRRHWKRGDGELTLFFGNLHDHTDLSVCARAANPPGVDLFNNERDIEGLDFCALTDHGYNMDRPQWAYQGEQTRFNHDPGRFVTFLGQEWTSSENPPAEPGGPKRYGHRNLVFLDPHHGKFYDAYDGDISPADLWRELEGTEFLCIPHQLADWLGKGQWNPPTDWSFTDEKLQPVAEIFQTRGSYEYLGCPRQARHGAPFKGHYLQDVWARGVVIGVIASADHGGGAGKVGVWAKELTRECIFEAVRARHTFGTSGAKMAVKFSSGSAIMGDKVERAAGPIRFSVHAAAMEDIKDLVIFRNNVVVHRLEPGEKEVEATWIDESPPGEKLLWYYMRIHAADNHMAWSSPIWFVV